MTSCKRSAHAKVNLCLFLGETRGDGRHELVTLFESVSLADELTLETMPGAAGDEVLCPGVEGPNLVSDALAALRAEGWSAPPVRVRIAKRIPVAAGMGGGSADAAAMLLYAPALAPVARSTLTEIAVGLGADVPSRLDFGPSIGTGAGEVLEPVAYVDDHTFVVVPQPFSLSTADVFGEADRLKLARPAQELAALRADLEATVRAGETAPRPLPERLIVNDLQAASVSLRPEIGDALALVLQAGADQAIVCGSGPTVIGVFWGARELARAQAAARRLRARYPGALAADPLARAIPAMPGRGTLARAPND